MLRDALTNQRLVTASCELNQLVIDEWQKLQTLLRPKFCGESYRDKPLINIKLKSPEKVMRKVIFNSEDLTLSNGSHQSLTGCDSEDTSRFCTAITMIRHMLNSAFRVGNDYTFVHVSHKCLEGFITMLELIACAPVNVCTQCFKPL